MFLRTVEHRLQMVADEQTHTLPSTPDGARGVRALHGLSRSRRLRDGAARPPRRGAAPLCAPVRGRAGARRRAPRPRVSTQGRRPRDPRQAAARWGSASRSRCRRRCGAGSPAPRGRCGGRRPATVFAELVPLLVDHIARAENPDAALVTFDRFLGNLHGGARLFSLLRQNPDLVALVASVLGTAPRLADTLAAHPQVMDALIDPASSARCRGRRRSRRRSRCRWRRRIRYEDFLDRVRAVRPGADVPDRRAHSLRHGLGAAGRRSLCRARRHGRAGDCIGASHG